MYPATAQIIITMQEIETEICVALVQATSVFSFMAEYSKKVLWWHMYAA